MNILIAEDESAIVGVLQRGFEAEHYTVDTAKSVHQAIPMLREHEYHGAIIDLDLPPTEGIAILEFVRERYQHLPTLVLTSCARVSERVHILDRGADDLLQKPFAFPELAARVRAIMRRGNRLPEIVLRVRDLELNRVEHTAKRAGRGIVLTPREFSLLEYLMQRPGQRASRAEIIQHVWNLSGDTVTNVVDVYINYLRKKIDTEQDCKLIHTVRGMGYELHSGAQPSYRVAQSCSVPAVS
ncbi:MAG TPA: response regulator transcription factor [Candidatus Sulfotelmatobacter sp.]|jgi:DNA-binding response OmpR family regulator|nr:response regulator transcription factor [Candidatus Sulfotelmatobacter sp.]